MAAIQSTRISPSLPVAAVALAAALLVGGAGGYLIRGVGLHGSAAPAEVGHNQAVKVAELPASVQAYMAPATDRQFKVDEFIRSLGYAAPADVPAWVQAYAAPAEEPQFKVDEFIRTLDYATPAELPASVQAYMTQAEEPQFKVDEFIRTLETKS